MAVGKIDTFQLGAESWTLYAERLEQYFVVNNVKEEMKVPTLITVMGGAGYELLVTLCTPVKPATKTFKDLVQIMANHLQPKPSILAERYTFRQRKQTPGESIANYVAELRRLSKHCGFGEKLEESLRDQLVCGVLNEAIRQRLFSEEDIQFGRALKLAVAIETAEVNSALVEGQKSPVETMTAACNAVGTHTQRLTTARVASRRSTAAAPAAAVAAAASGGRASLKSHDNQQCDVCGRRDHNKKFCKFAKYVCKVCNQPGHLKKMCPRLNGSAQRVKTYNSEIRERSSDTDSSNDDEVIHLFNFDSVDKSCKAIEIDVCIDGYTVRMEADTGCLISCISYELYQKCFSHIPLCKHNLIMSYYTGETVIPIGKISPYIKYKKVYKPLDLYVINHGRKPLIGRRWLHELGFRLEEVNSTPQPLSINCNEAKCSSSSFSVESLSSRYYNVFSDGLGRYTGGEVSLRVRADARPVYMRARPLAYALREPVERALEQLVADDIIAPVETSDWATPIVPVVKSDGSIRVCGDFKITLNKCLEVDRFPLPKVEDLLAKLSGGKKFSKLDLSQAYAQFVLDEESQKYCVINSHRGLFKFKRLVYGISSSPGIFQRKLEAMFADMPRVGVFLDDIIISGKNDQEHLDTLFKVLERLEHFGLKVKKEKCSFFADSVTYLGYVIDKNGIHTDPNKLKAIRKVSSPQNVTEVRAFLGMVMYYGKFIRNISTILGPLYALLKKGVPFNWTSECEGTFQKIKDLLSSSEVLTHYNPELPVILTTDASAVGVGAVISHVVDGTEHPVAYASRVLNSAERGYSQIDREALAIIYGVKKFHQYLYGRKFILQTDHKPLVSIFGSKIGIPTMAASRMQRWAVILSGYDYDIRYVSTSKNGADALSRLPIGHEKRIKSEITYVNFVSNFLPIKQSQVSEVIKKDALLCKVVMYIQSGWPMDYESELSPFYARRNELYLENNCIMWGYRIVIPQIFQNKILQELHVGHMGIVKMKSMARSYVWWPGIDKDIERLCKECHTCTVESPAPPRAPPQPWTYPAEPWTRLHMDFLGPFEGKSFFVLIDATSKWIEAFHMTSTTASAVLKVLRELFARFGLPKELVSDNGPPFTSEEVKKFMGENGITHKFSPPYHPASNGAAEGAVKLCKRALRKAGRDRYDIDTALQTYLMAYRNTTHSTTGVSPAMLLQRRNLRSRLDLLRSGSAVEERVAHKQQQQVNQSGGSLRSIEKGDPVWVREYSENKDKWVKGLVKDIVGERNFRVLREDGSTCNRHIDQLKSRSTAGILACSASPVNVDTATSHAPPGRACRVRLPVERYGNPISQ